MSQIYTFSLCRLICKFLTNLGEFYVLCELQRETIYKGQLIKGDKLVVWQLREEVEHFILGLFLYYLKSLRGEGALWESGLSCRRQGTPVKTRAPPKLLNFTGSVSVSPSDMQPLAPPELTAVQEGSRASRRDRNCCQTHRGAPWPSSECSLITVMIVLFLTNVCRICCVFLELHAECQQGIL